MGADKNLRARAFYLSSLESVCSLRLMAASGHSLIGCVLKTD